MLKPGRARAAPAAQPAKVRLNQHAYEAIKQDIIDGVLQPGTLISENELTEKLGISRTPVREALYRLESDRFLKIFPKKGILIPDISLKDVRDLYSIRAVLEPFAARLATGYIKLEDVERFRIVFEAENIGSPIELITIDQEFHNLLVKHSNNDYLISLLTGFYDHLHRLRVIIRDKIFEERSRIYAEHQEVIRALLARDEKQVESTLRKHLVNAAERMTQSFIANGKVNSTR